MKEGTMRLVIRRVAIVLVLALADVASVGDRSLACVGHPLDGLAAGMHRCLAALGQPCQ